MTGKPPTPDAVRAAIAWVLWWTQPGNYEQTPPLELPKSYTERANSVYNRLDKIGALRPVGDGDQWCLPISTLRNWLDWAESMGPMCGYGLHALINREVIAAEAARSGDELRPVGGDEFANFDIWDHANYWNLRTCGVSHDDAMELARSWIATKRHAAARSGDALSLVDDGDGNA